MNDPLNQIDSRQGQPPANPSKSHNGPFAEKNEKSHEIAEEDLDHKDQPLIHSIRYHHTVQSKVTPFKMTTLDLEPQNEEQDIKLVLDDRNHKIELSNSSLSVDSGDKVREEVREGWISLAESLQEKNQDEELDSLVIEARRDFDVNKKRKRKIFKEEFVRIMNDPKSFFQKKKNMGEILVESRDLLPEVVSSIEELKELYESKRSIKKMGRLYIKPLKPAPSCLPEVHQGGANCVIFTPDYKSIVTGSEDGSITILDVEMKQEIGDIPEAHTGKVKVLAMTSDGENLVSGSDDMSLKIFNFYTKEVTLELKEEHPITLLDIVDDIFIVYGFVVQDETFLKVFDLEQKQFTHSAVFYKRVESLKAISRQDVVLLTEDGSIIIVDLSMQAELHSFQASDFEKVTSMTIQYDRVQNSGLIIAGCDDGSVIVFDILNRNQIDTLRHEPVTIRKNPVKQVILSADRKYLFAGLKDGSIQMWNLEDHSEKKIFQGEGYGWDQIAVSKDTDFLIACSGRLQSISLVGIKQGKTDVICFKRSNRVGDKGVLFSISRDGQFILLATSAQEIQFLDPQTNQRVGDDFKLKRIISCLALSPDNNFIIIGSKDEFLEIFSFEGPEQAPKLYHSFGQVLNFDLPIISVTDNSRYLIATSEDTSFKIFDIKEKKEVHTFTEAHDKFISCLTATPDSKFVVSGSNDKSLKIFDILTKKEVHHFKEVHNGSISSVAVTPNNKFILSASNDLSIKVFDLETKHQIHEFVYSHDHEITTLSVSSDSRYIASGSADRSIKIFDIETKQLVSSLQNIHDESVMKVAFAPNDRYLVSMSICGLMKIINFKTTMEEEQFKRYGNLAAVINRKNQLILVLQESDSLRGIQMETEKEEFKIEMDRDEAINAVAVSLDNKFLIYGTTKGSVGLFDVQKNEKLPLLKGIHKNAKSVAAITAVAINCDEKFIISASNEKIQVNDLPPQKKLTSVSEDSKTKKNYHEFPNLHQDPFYSIAVIPNSQCIILISGDKSIKILDIQNKKQVYHFENAHRRPIKCVAVTGDGKFLVSCSEDRSIKVFDLKTKQLVHWFKNAHDDVISSLAVNTENGCSIIVSGSFDKSIKVFDLQTRQQIHHFQKVHTGDIKFITITSDNQYVISACSASCIKVLKLIPTSLLSNQINSPQDFRVKSEVNGSESEITFGKINPNLVLIIIVYNGFLHYSNFNAVDDFLFDMNVPIKLVCAIATRCSTLTIYPYRWNILHLVAIRDQDAFFKNMPEYAEFKVPFLLDTYSKTPLHYLIAQEKINFPCVNIMLNYICDYLDDLSQDQSYQTQDIIISLTPLFWFILNRTEVKIRARFFSLCCKTLPIPYNTELPAFGEMETDVPRFCPTLESIYDNAKVIWKNGEDQINFRSSLIKLDYSVLSSDMKKTVKYLLQQKDEDIFQATLIIDLIDYLWDQSKYILKNGFLVFSAYIIALSVYLSREDRSLAFEIIFLWCSFIFLCFEGLQFLHQKPKRDYFRDGWNYIDLAFHLLTLGYVIARISGLDQELVQAWLSSIILLLGYLRWISFLRVFEPTRSLIEVIVTVVRDMWSFIVIIALIIIGFSFIFLVFRRGRLYGFYLYNSYSSLYGPLDEDDYTPSPSELFFIALIAFLLNVIFLNLLIAIMSDSYVKVMDKRIKADSLTRLDMIREAVEYLRYYLQIKSFPALQSIPPNWWDWIFPCLKRLPANKDSNRGFLVRCKSLSSENADENKWEGRIKVFRKLFKQSKNSTKDEIKKSQQDLQQSLARIDQERKAGEERLEEKIISSEDRLQAELEKTRNDQNEKIDKILALLSEMNQQRAGQPNNQELQ